MTSYNTHPPLPSAPPDAHPLQSGAPPGPQVGHHLNVVQAKRRGLINTEKMFKKKYKKYNKILNKLTWLTACSSGISVATGISSVATFITSIGLPVSIPLGAASPTGAIASGIISVLMKKYQQKLKKVTKLIDIITSALSYLRGLYLALLTLFDMGFLLIVSHGGGAMRAPIITLLLLLR